MIIYLVESGAAYGPPHIVCAYRSKKLANLRCAKIEKEQELFERLLNDDVDAWYGKKWSDYACHDYCCVIKVRVY